MKVICCGSRTWTDRKAVRDRLSTYPLGTIVVHGHSRGGGADLIVDEEARALGLTVIPVPVDDRDYRAAPTRRAAPIFRNLRMLGEHPDAEALDAYWRDGSPGTEQMISAARRRGLPITIFVPQV